MNRLGAYKKRSLKKTNFISKIRYGRYRRRPMLSSRLSGDIVSYKCEAYFVVYIANGTSLPIFNLGNVNYLNFLNLLSSQSPSFTSMGQNYSFYKITGCSVRAMNAITEGVIDSQLGGYNRGFCMNIYPDTSVDQGSNPIYADTKFTYDPSLTGPQVKYWKIPNNWSQNGVGVGTWNQCTQVSSQTGQMSVAPTINAGIPDATANTVLATVKITLYCQFKDFKN